MEIEHERVEVALQKSESKFSRIFNAVPALIGITTLKEGRFIDVNQASLQTLGYQREEMLGKTARELGLWEDEAERLKVMRLFMEQGSLQNLEIRFKGKTGQTFTGLCSAEFIELDDLRYMLILVRNITERKIAEEEIARLNQNLAMRAAELEDANRELEAFNYSVAHDLRQPLNVICSYCQIFTELCSDKLEKPCRRYIQETYDGARRMSRLIEALLNFSRLSHVETIRKRVDLSAMAREAFLTLKLVEPGRQVEFRSADGIFAHADATLLRVVLDNLLGNAWKYTGMQTEAVIEFGAMEPDGNTVFYIRDNGAGFDMKHADQLFTPFQRLPGAEECRGFGIGLATVERIIRRHGGTIWGEGEPGKGATFYFTLGSENRTPGGEHHEDPDS
jgi:PAS domain S-box-containing protein